MAECGVGRPYFRAFVGIVRSNHLALVRDFIAVHEEQHLVRYSEHLADWVEYLESVEESRNRLFLTTLPCSRSTFCAEY